VSHKKYKGYMLAELIVGFTILGALLIGLTVSLHGFAKLNLYQLVKQNCIAAGQAQLDCIAVTGKPISDQTFKKLWPKLDVSVSESAGTGQWEGTKLVEVTTKGKSYNINVKVRLSRYITTEQSSAGQEK
jgi:hypothetical protein